MPKFVLTGLFVAVIATGCGKRTIDDEDKSKSGEAAAKKEAVERPKPVPRDSIAGNWVIEISRQQTGVYQPMMLVSINKNNEGTYGVRMLDAPRELGEPLIEPGTALSADAASFRVSIGGGTPRRNQSLFSFDVVRRRDNLLGLVIMNPDIFAQQPQMGLRPVRFYPTTETTLEKFQQPVPHPHLDVFRKAVAVYEQKADVSGLAKFADEHPESPLTLDAVEGPLNPFQPFRTQSPAEVAPAALPSMKTMRAHLKRMADVLPHWGNRTHHRSRFMFAFVLYQYRYAPELMLEILDKLQTAEVEGSKKYLQPGALAQFILAAELEVAFDRALRSDNAANRDAAVERLKEFGKKGLQNQPLRLYALAEAARRTGDRNAALRHYAQLLVLPGLLDGLRDDLKYRRIKMPDIQKRFEGLWKQSGRPTTQQAAFFDMVYDDAIYAFLENFSPDPENYAKRRVLVEFFTGSESPRCAAADVSVGAVLRSFQPSDVVVLRYHLPVPKAGPLICEASNLVSRQFGGQRPPDILFNGRPPTLPGGGRGAPSLAGTLVTNLPVYWASLPEVGQKYAQNMVQMYEYERSHIVALLHEEPSPYRLTLSAERNGDTVAIRAKVAVSKDPEPDVRLRFVLAEDHVDYNGANKTRRHEMVVRGMPGGVRGLKVDKKDGTYEMKADLKELFAELQRYLAALKGKGKSKQALQPAEFRNLHLVGIVQNGKTGNVHDVASVVVLGKASKFVDRHAFGPVFAPRPLRALREKAMRPPPPPLPVTPGKKG